MLNLLIAVTGCTMHDIAIETIIDIDIIVTKTKIYYK